MQKKIFDVHKKKKIRVQKREVVLKKANFYFFYGHQKLTFAQINNFYRFAWRVFFRFSTSCLKSASSLHSSLRLSSKSTLLDSERYAIAVSNSKRKVLWLENCWNIMIMYDWNIMIEILWLKYYGWNIMVETLNNIMNNMNNIMVEIYE